jgi:succinate-semialdehyde dehydrogenase/glutarate-semialdehyde dehydrogenase
MLGNVVLVKPAEISAGSTLFFDHLFDKAGFPPGGLPNRAPVDIAGISVHRRTRIRAVTLTGSDRVGSDVGAQPRRPAGYARAARRASRPSE